jgi:hypothetical protein
VAVDAEDLLNHDHRAARLAGGVGAVGGELVPVGCAEFDHLPHLILLFQVGRPF